MKQIVSIIALVFSLFTCASLGVFAQQSDASLLGFKGQVKSVYIKDNNALLYQFDEQGMLGTFSMQVGLRYFDAQLVYRADKYYSGLVDCEEMFYDSEFDLSETNYKVYFTSGRVSRASFQFVLEGEYYFDTYSIVFNAEQVYKYNERGEVSAMSIDFKLDDELKQLSKQKINSQHIAYKNYAYDEYGNWISRDCYVDNVLKGTEERIIAYYPRFLSQKAYEKALAAGDADEMKRLAMDRTNTSGEVRQKAAAYWNEYLSQEINGKYKYQWGQLFEIMSLPIVDEDNRATIETIIRQHVWDTQVLPERDFQKVRELSDLTYNGWRLFDAEYVDRIQQRSDQLRTDSVARLYQAACYEYNQKQYNKAIGTLNQVLDIDEYNQNAKDLLVGANYYILQDRIQNKTASADMFKSFLRKYDDSRYRADVQDQYVEYMLEQLPNNRTMSAIGDVRSMPVNDDKLRKKVKHVTHRQEFILNRGRFLHFGCGFDVECGPGALAPSGELCVRLGYVPSWVNFYIAGRFGVITNPKADTFDEGYFRVLRATVPVQLRVNFAKDYEVAGYLGLGADVNFNVKAKVIGADAQKYVDEFLPSDSHKHWINRTTYSPRIGLGMCHKHFDFEVYGLYDLQPTFNQEYLDQIQLRDQMDPEFYDAQLKNKWRIGLAMRVFF